MAVEDGVVLQVGEHAGGGVDEAGCFGPAGEGETTLGEPFVLVIC